MKIVISGLLHFFISAISATDFNLSVLERKSTGESSSSNQFSLTWKAYAVSIWKPCEPKPIFHCSAAILSRKILVTSLPEVVDEDVNKNIQVGYVVLVGPVDNVDAFVTKIENSMSIKQNNVWVGCTLLMLEESISLDGLDDIPWESYSPDEKFVYYTFAFEHDSNGKVVAFPKVKKVAFQSLNACASRDELFGKDYNLVSGVPLIHKGVLVGIYVETKDPSKCYDCDFLLLSSYKDFIRAHLNQN